MTGKIHHHQFYKCSVNSERKITRENTFSLMSFNICGWSSVARFFTGAVSLNFHLKFQFNDDNPKCSSSNCLAGQVIFDTTRNLPRFLIKGIIHSIEITVTLFAIFTLSANVPMRRALQRAPRLEETSEIA